ncbi:MAG: hypothetical protein QOC96_2709 [Acidobacteriota bacterium]|jgi:hypothetical protein|nr:hypothetical protein [Acidobacteriota bacterium]
MTRLYTFAAILFLSLLCCGSINVSAQSPDRAQMLQEMTSLRDRLKEIEKQYIPPAPEDRAAFASFLQQPGTGIMRLLPREKFDGFLAMRGGGAYYSFTRLTNDYNYGSDIGLEQGYLSVGFAGADFGMLTSLGSVTLDEVKPELPAVEYLTTFNTPTKESEARVQQRQVGNGYTINGVAYQNRLPAHVNHTYVLRSINYRESDILVAFRVVRRDADGSLIIVWKMLKEFPIPQLERSDVALTTGN